MKRKLITKEFRKKRSKIGLLLDSNKYKGFFEDIIKIIIDFFNFKEQLEFRFLSKYVSSLVINKIKGIYLNIHINFRVIDRVKLFIKENKFEKFNLICDTQFLTFKPKKIISFDYFTESKINSYNKYKNLLPQNLDYIEKNHKEKIRAYKSIDFEDVFDYFTYTDIQNFNPDTVNCEKFEKKMFDAAIELKPEIFFIYTKNTQLICNYIEKRQKIYIRRTYDIKRILKYKSVEYLQYILSDNLFDELFDTYSKVIRLITSEFVDELKRDCPDLFQKMYATVGMEMALSEEKRKILVFSQLRNGYCYDFFNYFYIDKKYTSKYSDYIKDFESFGLFKK